MQPRDAAAAVVDALTPSRRQVVGFVLTFVVPWLVGMAWLSAYAVRFVYRVWGWLT